ncbi:MAG: hypothetical protein JNM17_33825 [Archangium sp.]|nr:hypothetical protein [Archangium sp.]
MRPVVAILVTLIGCAPPLEVKPQPNRPLRIVSRSPEGPSTRFFTQASCAPAGQTFSLGVVDDDTNDTISSLWFVDQAPTSVPFTTTPRPPGASTTRTVNAPAAPSFMTTLNDLTLGTHLLTVYVADTPFNEVVNGNVTVGPRMVGTRAADGGVGAVQEPGYIDEFTWVLNVERCP